MSNHIHDCPGCGGYFWCVLDVDECTETDLCRECRTGRRVEARADNEFLLRELDRLKAENEEMKRQALRNNQELSDEMNRAEAAEARVRELEGLMGAYLAVECQCWPCAGCAPDIEKMRDALDKTAADENPPPLRDEICALLNSRSRENVSDTPDGILAAFMENTLVAFESATRARDHWYRFEPWKTLKELEVTNE